MGLTANDIAALGPDARRQIALAILKDEAQKKAVKKNKYNAEKTAYNGEAFDSTKEADRFAELLLLQRAGKIFNLQRQVPYELIPPQERPDGKREFPVRYIADFVYKDGNGRMVAEDVKGYKGGAAYKLFVVKRKLMLLMHHIAVEEV
jgi:hypothetical protein